jgi:KTSC domain
MVYRIEQGPTKASTCVADVNYNPKTETMTITFQQRGSHSYTGVSQSEVDSFLGAGSLGKFFNRYIR